MSNLREYGMKLLAIADSFKVYNKENKSKRYVNLFFEDMFICNDMGKTVKIISIECRKTCITITYRVFGIDETLKVTDSQLKRGEVRGIANNLFRMLDTACAITPITFSADDAMSNFARSVISFIVDNAVDTRTFILNGCIIRNIHRSIFSDSDNECFISTVCQYKEIDINKTHSEFLLTLHERELLTEDIGILDFDAVLADIA